MKQIDLAYLAGLIDADGYIGIKKSKAYKSQERQTPRYQARIQVRMVSEDAIAFLASTLGGWYYKEKPSAAKGRPLFCYQASDKKAEEILRALLPHLKIKKQPAETALALRDLQKNGRAHRTKIVGYRTFHHHAGRQFRIPNKAYSDDYIAQCDRLYQRCRELNRAGT